MSASSGEPAYSLRPAGPDDREWLDMLRRQAYRVLFDLTWGGWDESRHLRHFAASWRRGNISIVEIAGRPVGMIQTEMTDEAIEVREIQILPSHQNRGLGHRLLLGVLEDARRSNVKVVLSVGLKNERALRLYRRMGFQVLSRSDTHVNMSFD